jgi:hypothetical protein
MLNDEQLDTLLDRARPAFRAPPRPDLDALWEGVEARRARSLHRGPRPWWQWVGLAAAVMLAFALGRASTQPHPAIQTAESSPSRRGPAPVTDVATDLLGQTVVLLSALPEGQPATTSEGGRFARQAGELLLTTRLLLDSPDAQQRPALRTLLEDLELVLAQLARLSNGETRAELEIITEAMQQQDLVPRIRHVAAGLGAGAD